MAEQSFLDTLKSSIKTAGVGAKARAAGDWFKEKVNPIYAMEKLSDKLKALESLREEIEMANTANLAAIEDIFLKLQEAKKKKKVVKKQSTSLELFMGV